MEDEPSEGEGGRKEGTGPTSRQIVGFVGGAEKESTCTFPACFLYLIFHCIEHPSV